MHRSVPKLHQHFLKKTEAAQFRRPSLIKGKLETLIKVLAKPPKERTPEQIQELMGYMGAVTFFAELVAKVGQEAFQQCCQHMSQEYYREGQVPITQFVFHAEEEGHKFYVILSGSVTVLRPNGRIDGKRTYQQLAILKEGSSFGELALLQSSARTASIRSREDTFLGVLGRQDYLRILGKVQELLLAKKISLIQSNPVFAKWTKNSLVKLTYFFKERSFARKQVLFHAGDEALEVFLVKTGDFQLVKDISVQVRKSPHQLKETEQARCQAEVTLVSIGELLGGQEAIRQIPHRYTCICSSWQAEALAISREDFLMRMTSEEAVNTVLALSDAIEAQREQRLLNISNRERATRDINHLLYAQSLAQSNDVPNTVLHAKLELEAEVRDRWCLPKSRKYSVLQKAQLPVLHTFVRSQPCSPIGSPRPQAKHSMHERSWSDIMKAKFQRKSERSPTCKQVVNIHTQKLKEANSRYLQIKREIDHQRSDSSSRLDMMRMDAFSPVGFVIGQCTTPI